MIEQAKVHPGLVKDNARLSNPLPHMQMGTTHNGDDLEMVAAAKRWLFQELHGWWADYDKCVHPSSSACHLLMIATAQWMLTWRMPTHRMLMLDVRKNLLICMQTPDPDSCC